MSPVIPHGTVCIGAIGRVARLPRYASTLPRAVSIGGSITPDTIVPAHVLNVSWSADHRVIDGATLARFSSVWKGLVERPETMLGLMR